MQPGCTAAQPSTSRARAATGAAPTSSALRTDRGGSEPSGRGSELGFDVRVERAVVTGELFAGGDVASRNGHVVVRIEAIRVRGVIHELGTVRAEHVGPVAGLVGPSLELRPQPLRKGSHLVF